MKHAFIVRAAVIAGFLALGAGCTPWNSSDQATSTGETPTPTSTTAVDPYAGWGTITPGGIATLRIPPGCIADPAAGNLYVACPPAGSNTSTPNMHISSDGAQLNIRRWQNRDWNQWDRVIESLDIVTPVDGDIQINIEE